ncbi:MAG: MarR family transcriptional regulator [Desulfarculaceae bacterium]
MRFLRLLRSLRPVRELSWSRISILGYLNREGTSTASSLAAYLRVKPQSLTRLLADLEESKLISRQPDPADLRQSLLEISERGRQLLSQEIREQRLTLAKIISQELTPVEQGLLGLTAGLLDRLASIIQEHETPALEKSPPSPQRAGGRR